MSEIGACVERIVIQSKVETEGADGGESSTALTTLATVSAEFIPRSVAERLLPTGAIGEGFEVMFRVRRRVDVTPKMLVSWTPTWPKNATAKTFEIRGVLPKDDGRTWMFLTCSTMEFA